jgi:excisionase family DNA binding protein
MSLFRRKTKETKASRDESQHRGTRACSVSEVAEMLGVNVKTVRRMVDTGQLRVIRIGSPTPGARRPYLLRIPRDSVESLLQGRVLPPGGTHGGET